MRISAACTIPVDDNVNKVASDVVVIVQYV